MVKRSAGKVLAGRMAPANLYNDPRKVAALVTMTTGLAGSAADLSKQFSLSTADAREVISEHKKIIGRGYAVPQNLRGEVAVADQFGMFGMHKVDAFNPSALVSRKGLTIFDKMRKDDQVKAALSFKKLAALASGWELQVPEDLEDEGTWEPAEFVRDTLRNIEGSFHDVLYEVLSALDYGYSVSELIFEEVEQGPWRGKIGLKALKTRPPHGIDFQTDKHGNLLEDGIRQRIDGKFVALPREKFVLFAHQPQFGNPYGTSDLEAAYRTWWLKENAYRWLAMLLERFGIPPIFALYNPQRFNNEQINALTTVVNRLQAATSGAMPRPDKDSLELWSPELAGQTERVFIPAIEMFNKDIARALLMPNQLGMTSENSTGSFARSKVQFDVFMVGIDALRNRLEDTVMDQIVRMLVDLNFAVEEYPRFQFLPYANEARVDLLTAWHDLVGMGIVTPQAEDEDHIRRLFKFPERQGESVSEGLPPGGAPALREPQQGPGEGEGEEESLLTVHPPQKIAFNAQREPNKFEKRVNFGLIERELDEAEARMREKLVPLLRAVKLKTLKKIQRGFNKNIGFIKTFRSLVSVNTLHGPFLQELTAIYDKGAMSIASELGTLAFAESRPTHRPVDAMRALRARADFFVSGINEDLTKKVKNALLKALDTGEPLEDTILRLETLFEPYVGNPNVIRDGDVIEPHRLETIIRTNLTDAFNRGRLVAAEAAGDLLVAWEYSAILDAQTTEVCRFLDGKLFKPKDTWLQHLRPPRHFNCRSVLVPITADIEVDEEDFITSAAAGRAEGLSGTGFKAGDTEHAYCTCGEPDA